MSKAEDSLPVSQINKEDMELHAMMYVNRAGEGEEGRHISLDWRGEGGGRFTAHSCYVTIDSALSVATQLVPRKSNTFSSMCHTLCVLSD